MSDETHVETTTTPAAGNNGAQVAPIGTPVPSPVPNTAPPPGQAAQIKEPDPAEIGRTISKPENAAAAVPNAPQAEQPVQFDLSKLRPEQLQELKALLQVTPERANIKKSNPIVTLRRFSTTAADGQVTSRIIVDFKTAYETFVRDEILNATKEMVMIPVRFLGDIAGKFTNIPYREFINSDQVRCEVIGTRSVPGRIVEGEVLSKELGRIIEREVKTLDTFFTVKLPEGTEPAQIEIEARIANG